MTCMKRLSAALLCVIILMLSFVAVNAEDTDYKDVYPVQSGAESGSPADSAAGLPAEPADTGKIIIDCDTETTLLGDIDSDGRVTIDDALFLQFYFAQMLDLSETALPKTDSNLDGDTTIIDVTVIQRFLAGFTGRYYLGLDVGLAKEAKDADDEAQRRQAILDEIDNYTAQKGVDISVFNGDIDMNKLKAAGFTFVMIRLGYGDDEASQDDKMFETNVRKAEAAGLDWGAYIYSYALSVGEAKSEVNHTLRLLKGKKPTMPIAFDWEDDSYKERMGMPSNAEVRRITETYLSGIRDAGYYPILYTGYSWLKGAFKDSSILDNYDIWYPQWAKSYDYRDRPIGMWQYGGEENYIDTPYIPGISGAIDKDYSFKNYPMIIKAYGYNNHTALLDADIAAVSAPYFGDAESENLPEGLGGVMGDSMRE